MSAEEKGFKRDRALALTTVDILEQTAQATGFAVESREALLASDSFYQLNEQLRRSLFRDLGDTYKHIPWKKLESIVTGFGFEVLSEASDCLTRLFPPSPYHDRPQKYLVAANRDKRLLLIAESWFDKRDDREGISTGFVYGVVSYENIVHPQHLRLGGHLYAKEVGTITNGKGEIALEVGEGVISRIEHLEDLGLVFVDWHEPNPFHVFASFEYVPHGYIEPYDITSERRLDQKQQFLASLPGWVREFVNE